VPEVGDVVDETRLKKGVKSNKINKKTKMERKNGGNLGKTHQKSTHGLAATLEIGRRACVTVTRQ